MAAKYWKETGLTMKYKMREGGTAGVPSSFTLRQVLLAQKEEGGIAPAPRFMCAQKSQIHLFSCFNNDCI